MTEAEWWALQPGDRVRITAKSSLLYGLIGTVSEIGSWGVRVSHSMHHVHDSGWRYRTSLDLVGPPLPPVLIDLNEALRLGKDLREGPMAQSPEENQARRSGRVSMRGVCKPSSPRQRQLQEHCSTAVGRAN
jgi:hypothetical protein